MGRKLRGGTMIVSKHGKLLVENRGPGIRVVRFIHPDIRDQIYDVGKMEDCRLYSDLKASALSYIAEGETLVVNLALLEHFGTELYSILLKVREVLMARNGCVILCGANAETRELLGLFKADRLFGMARTEAEALELARPFRNRLESSLFSESIPEAFQR